MRLLKRRSSGIFLYEHNENEKDKGFGMCRPCLFLLNTVKHNRKQLII
ncbi:Hypothetical protein ACI5QL_03544 [Bacillus velezensis]